MTSRQAIRLLVSATRVAPWSLAAAQSWLLQRLLTQHGRALAVYDEFHDRLDRVEQTLDRLTDSPHPEGIASSGPNSECTVNCLAVKGAPPDL
jgi:hypothetical protein